MQGDKELEGWQNLPFVCQCSKLVAGDGYEFGRGYSAPCMLQESPRLPIVLMCLVERRSPRMGKVVGRRS